MSIFVTDGDQRATLAVVRALGQAGIRVTVGSSSPTSLAGSSRYCAEQVCYPSPVVQRTEFQSFILAQARDGRYRVLLPMTDITMQLVAEIGQSLELARAFTHSRPVANCASAGQTRSHSDSAAAGDTVSRDIDAA